MPLVPAGAGSPDSIGGLTIENLAPASVDDGAKAPSSRLAQTDPTLLSITSSAAVEVLVKLDYDATAAYEGGISGLAPTSPEVTGRSPMKM